MNDLAQPLDMNVIIYCRVSTEDQNVNQQSEYLKEYCRRSGFKILKIIKDKESGRLPLKDRKQFMKLMYETNPSYNAILVYNLDRLTRNWDDVTMIEKYFRDNWDSVKLISTSDSIDLSNASGRFMFRIRMATACYMPEDMKEKQVIGINRAKKEGKYKGGKKGRTWANKQI